MPSRFLRNPSLTPAAGHPYPSLVPFHANDERSAPAEIVHNAPDLSAMTGLTATSPPTRRGHSRSISHPFPSPFTAAGGKRRPSISKKKPSRPALDSDDDDFLGYMPDPASSSPRNRPPQHGAMAAGKCMACNCTVRWPRDLKVFRCTECLTVNDLEPYLATAKAGGHGNAGVDGKSRTPMVPRKALPLSLERTKGLLDDCITEYLRQVLHGTGPRATLSGGQPDKPQHIAQDENLVHTPGPTGDYLCDPRATVDSRGRGYSASRSGKLDGPPNFSKPNLSPYSSQGEGKSSPMKSRDAQSRDTQTMPRQDRSPRDAGQGNLSDTKELSRRPHIFWLVEDYIINSFKGCDCLNSSFTTVQAAPRSTENSTPPEQKEDKSTSAVAASAEHVFEPDAKLLLLGDIAENSSWWMNEVDPTVQSHSRDHREKSPGSRAVSSRSPRIDWAVLARWYHLIMTAGTSWVELWSTMKPAELRTDEDIMTAQRWDSTDLAMVEKEVVESRLHLQRTLLKATENLLKRPRRPLKKPEDIRFLLMLLANPLLNPSNTSLASYTLAPSAPRGDRRPSHPILGNSRPAPRDIKPLSRIRSGGPGHHAGIVKRIMGLLANLPNDCHHYLVSWFSRYSTGQFEKIVEIVGSFVTYRLMRQHGRKRSETAQPEDSLIPSFSSAAGNTPAELHAAINGRSPNKSAKDDGEQPVVYTDDWQIRAAARVMSLLFTANNATVSRKPDGLGSTSRPQSDRRGHMVPISSFYNTLLDYSDLVADFEAWESKSSKFSFCQYPFFLSIWAKIHILEHDARRQMEVKAREAFFNSILSRKAISQYLVFKVRRDCLVEDSLRRVSEVVGSSHEEIKKGLRIEFVGEEGVDAGGLRKEWFLLLVREVFDPHHGLFVYDEDSRYCYFNPYCFESSEQFFLVGVLLGLAIYNSTILDIALPPFAFKKLLAAAPQWSTSRSVYKATLEDLAEFRPALAKGLRALLEFEGDVTETFCYDFVAQVDRYGEAVSVPLCAGGEDRPVTNANRREFVDLYVQYLLDTAVTRQFEPFKRGFFTVCGGNALSLFRPEEIELLVRGSDEALDVASLRAVATYENWSVPRPEAVPVVRWFWEIFGQAAPQSQRKILSFITGSDRIPAMGATSLSIRLACLGDDTSRFPTARTCFNQLGLYRYETRDKLERVLWDAVLNSEGFGLK
ncbi:E3 ubiquitin protein ligase [Aspergillus saccharolyticus JOP 1030-1]|uniref:HECT-type E3 ubiquitin transferase n=1 Tax=Aspergillus saccharolyticus JOP 1030-1 TaxID=1450539 RepID=A0A318ZDD5_9EURO|nr:E3 ubiquitin protein ligase [Aspergillus saccharolyticus JOP 1030-1]PYH44314.1 E3 ubiquitin protein ligase [Aspergillus saccharolyticus JOP 1030-1]